MDYKFNDNEKKHIKKVAELKGVSIDEMLSWIIEEGIKKAYLWNL